MPTTAYISIGNGDDPPSRFHCPNTPPCPHPGFVHDIDEPGGREACCVDGCACGKGDAVRVASPVTEFLGSTEKEKT